MQHLKMSHPFCLILRKGESLSLIPGDDEIEVVLAAVKSVADPKGFLSIKAITKLLLSEEKCMQNGKIIVL